MRLTPYLLSALLLLGGNRYTGWVFNEQFNERGNVQLSQRGSRLSVTVTSSRGIANLTLSRG
jgi:hypothetical protein